MLAASRMRESHEEDAPREAPAPGIPLRASRRPRLRADDPRRGDRGLRGRGGIAYPPLAPKIEPAAEAAAAPAPRDGGFTPIPSSDFEIRGGKAATAVDAKDGDWFFDGTVLHILTSTPLAVRTTPQPVAGKEGEFTPKQTAQSIRIEPGVKADLTLAGVTIASTVAPIDIITNKWDTADKSAAVTPADILHKTMLHLTLADGSVNTLTCTTTGVGSKGSPALRCGYGSVLVIDDEVRNLDASNNIVTPVNGVVPYDVTLATGQSLQAGDPLSRMDSANPGTLKATHGGHSACIGGGPKEDSGTIIINGGIVYANGNTGNSDCNTGAGIGGGDGGSGTVITINGGVIDAQAPYHGAGIGAGWSWKNPGNLAHDDALTIPNAPQNNGYNQYGGGDPSDCYLNVGGDITINGGFVKAKAGGHGNAFGQACGGTPSSNRNHIMRVTGGTLLPTGMVDRFDIGGNYGYLIITGGSVNCNVWDQNRTVNTYPSTNVYKGDYKFQGIGGTAFNTPGITEWSQIQTLEGGALPEKDKVKLVTIDLSPDIVGADKNCKIEDWELYVNSEKRTYGAPSYLDNGKLYLWLSSEDAVKPVAVELKYRDEKGEVVELETIETLGDGGSAAKRWVKFDLDEKNFPGGLTKHYDGLPLAKWSVEKTPIEVTSKTGITRKLDKDFDDAGNPYVTFAYQLYKDDGTLGPMSEEATEMPADAGRMHFTMHSTQFAKDKDLSVTYWGHETSGDCVITEAKAVVNLSSSSWVRLNEADGSHVDVNEGDELPGTHLRLVFDIQSASSEALTCRQPTGHFQVLVDGEPVGEQIALDDEAVKKASGTQHSTVSTLEGPVDADDKTKKNRWATQVTYFLDPTLLDGELDAADGKLDHEVTVQYVPDKNYVESVENNPSNAATAPTTIIPVKPKEEVTAGGTKLDFKEDRASLKLPYSQFNTEGGAASDFFNLSFDSTSAAKVSYVSSNPAVADIERDEDGNPVFDEDGNVKVQVFSCGNAVITMTQGANAFYSGQRRILDLTITPDPTIRPQVQIRLTQRNLTALAEAQGALLSVTPFALAAADALGVEPYAARAAVDRASMPPRPGDLMEYTVTGLNLTQGSAWQAAELRDAIDQRLTFDAESVETAANYETPDSDPLLGTPAFYQGFEWDKLDWAPVDRGTGDDEYRFDDASATLSKLIGTVYGGQSTSVRFQARVGENQGLGERPGDDGKLPELKNEPEGSGGFGKDEKDLAPGEKPVPPETLDPDVDIVVVGDDDPDPSTPNVPSSPKPTPVLPKDPAAADIVTTVTVEQTGHREEHDDDRILVGDTLTVTVTSTNKGPDSKLVDAVVRATLPVGMEPKDGTIRLTAGGRTYDVPMSAYDPKTGVIAVNAGDLYFGESAVLTFDVEVVSTSETRLPEDPDGPGKPGDPDDPSDPSDPSDPGKPDPTRPEGPAIEGGALGGTPTDEWGREHPTDPDAEPADPADKPKPGTPFEPGGPWEDLEDDYVATLPATDPGMPPVLPADPKLEDDEEGPADVRLAKVARNLDRDDGTTRVGDVVRYTVTLSNARPHTMWYGAVIRDVVPVGVEPLSESIRVTGPDGAEHAVLDDAYDPGTRVLAVAVGDLVGGRSATLVFDALVTEEALGADVGNVAAAFGTRPSEAEPGEVAGGAPRPVPGTPFAPEGGWDEFLEGRPGVDNAQAPAYAPGTDGEGGVRPAEQPGGGDGAAGPGAGAGDGGKGSRTPIRLAQTGDELVAPSVALVLAAAAAGVMLMAAAAQRRSRREALARRHAGRW